MTMLMIKMIDADNNDDDDDNDEDLSVPARALPKSPVPRTVTASPSSLVDNYHDHDHKNPTRCTKCGDPFGDGEEMYLQGAAIWHPR